MPLRGFLVRLSVAALVMTLAPMVHAQPALAASSLECAASATIYTTRNNAFLRYQHLEPETGANSWGTQQQIGTWGLTARRVAGPDGVIYNAVNTGELRRLRWNGTAWDIFPNGLNYEVIDTDPLWAGFSTPESFNKIAVDALGDIYTLEGNNVHWRRYNYATRTWAHKVAEYYFDFDMIAAAGNGVIYVYSTGGAMRRLDYDGNSNRSQSWSVSAIGGSPIRIFSPGADILYGVLSTGELMWYRYNPDTRSWASGTAGRLAGTGWQHDYETFAAPDACRLVPGTPWPTRPPVNPVPSLAPVTLMLTDSGHVHYAYADTEGRAVYGHTTSLTDGIRLAAVPGVVDISGPTSIADYGDDRMVVLGNGLDAEIHGNVQNVAGGTWGTAFSAGGYFAKPAIVTRQVPVTFACVADQDGAVWMIGQGSWGDPVTSWKKTGITADAGDSPISVLPTMGLRVFRVLYYDRTTTTFSIISRSANGSVGTRRSLGSSGFMDHLPSVVDKPDVLTGNGTIEGFVHVYATGTDRTVYAQLGLLSAPWTPLPGVRAAGPPSAILAPDDLVKIVVRGTDGFIYHTSQTAPRAVTFEPWQPIPGSDESATDPTALPVPDANTWVVAYRTDLDWPVLRRYQPPGPAVATAAAFVPVPLTL